MPPTCCHCRKWLFGAEGVYEFGRWYCCHPACAAVRITRFKAIHYRKEETN